MECKTSNWGCVYHACMSNDCQKAVMLEQDSDFGPGRCEIKVHGSKHRTQDRTCRYCSYNAEPGGCGESKGSDDTCEYFSPKS